MDDIVESWKNYDVKIHEISQQRLKSENDDSFYVSNTKDVEAKLRFWKREFNRVEPFFAMKANHCDVAIEVLANLGTGFDCASKNEIKKFSLWVSLQIGLYMQTL